MNKLPMIWKIVNGVEYIAARAWLAGVACIAMVIGIYIGMFIFS